MPDSEKSGDLTRVHLLAPLAVPVFRRVWIASMFSNMGLLVQGVGAAWAMVQLSSNDPAMVALVQTALFVPVMLFSMAAGAFADAFDRRKVALVALSISLVCTACLVGITFADLLNSHLLLLLSFGIGTGISIFGPTWQAAVNEQVPKKVLAQAVALNSISFNIARSFGPAVGGFVVAIGGAVAAFTLNAVFYLPMIVVLLLWRNRVIFPSRLPAESTTRAVLSGIRFICYSPPIRTVLIRLFTVAVPGAAVAALMPLIANSLLSAGAQTYGILLGAMGFGAILGGVIVGSIRDQFRAEHIATICALIYGACVIALGLSRLLELSIALLVVAGTVWMLTMTQLNIIVQLSAPRWVLGRVLAAYQASVAGGLALGSWTWGHVAANWGVGNALIIAGLTLLAVPLLGLVIRLPDNITRDTTPVELGEVDVALPLTGVSGPIAIDIRYHVAPERARDFYLAMMNVEQVRVRNGAFDWFIARDIADTSVWIERFKCATWHDYLRLRDRNTQTDLDLMHFAMSFDSTSEGVLVHRWLVRPFGSVRWREDAPDYRFDDVMPHPPGI